MTVWPCLSIRLCFGALLQTWTSDKEGVQRLRLATSNIFKPCSFRCFSEYDLWRFFFGNFQRSRIESLNLCGLWEVCDATDFSLTADRGHLRAVGISGIASGTEQRNHGRNRSWFPHKMQKATADESCGFGELQCTPSSKQLEVLWQCRFWSCKTKMFLFCFRAVESYTVLSFEGVSAVEFDVACAAKPRRSSSQSLSRSQSFSSPSLGQL